jgi:hypothetical protein
LYCNVQNSQHEIQLYNIPVTAGARLGRWLARTEPDSSDPSSVLNRGDSELKLYGASSMRSCDREANRTKHAQYRTV